MRGRLMNAWGTRAAAVAAGLGAILFTAGCGAAQNGAAGVAQSAATQSAATQPGAPVVVGCEPNQRTLVRSTVVNGVAVSQVDCVSNVEQAAYAHEVAKVALKLLEITDGIGRHEALFVKPRRYSERDVGRHVASS